MMVLLGAATEKAKAQLGSAFARSTLTAARTTATHLKLQKSFSGLVLCKKI
jgi:hypothetical protein